MHLRAGAARWGGQGGRVAWDLSCRENFGKGVGIAGIRSESALEGWGNEVGRAREEGAVGSLEAERTVGEGWAFGEFGV